MVPAAPDAATEFKRTERRHGSATAGSAACCPHYVNYPAPANIYYRQFPDADIGILLSTWNVDA
jgi:hydroxymethylglutaryl-CoA reductase